MAKQGDVKKLKIRTNLLPCKLNNTELLEYGNELGSVIQDIAAEEDRQISLKQELKARLTTLEAQRTALATKITRKEELRDVEIQPSLNFTAGVYREVRLDTSEVIKERPLTDDERQEKLDLSTK